MTRSKLVNNADTTVEVETKNKAVAFVNWSLPMGEGKYYKCQRGFVINQNPDFPNKGEDLLVNLAKKYNGHVEVMLKCRIQLNNSVPTEELDLDSIEIL